MAKVTYKNSGVDIDAGEKAVELIKPHVKKTFNDNVLAHIGGFGSVYQLDLASWKSPLLISSVDGVGTKLLVAKMMGIYDTIGQDLVNHCVNDIFVQGAIPQYFMDYIGVGKLIPEKIEKIVKGLTTACIENQMALIGGEMAEMPGIYHPEDFDVVGMIVGLVERDKLITGKEIEEDDYVIGFPSTGLHTNGYSLARKVLFDILKLNVNDKILSIGVTVGEALLSVHKSYYPNLKSFVANNKVAGMAHITGGGIPGNLKRVIPDGLTAHIYANSWEIPELYKFMQKGAALDTTEMFRAFNMGIGYITVIKLENVDEILKETDGLLIGRIKKATSDEKVTIHYR